MIFAASISGLLSGVAVAENISISSGFNLIGNGTTTTIDVLSVFGNQDSPVPNVTSNVDSVWSWNATTQKWRFHSPRITAAENSAYASAHGYEVLASIPGGTGFWVFASTPFNLATPSGAAFNYGLINFSGLPGGFNLLSTGSTLTVSQFNALVGSPPPPGPPPVNFNALWAWDSARGNWYFGSSGFSVGHRIEP